MMQFCQKNYCTDLISNHRECARFHLESLHVLTIQVGCLVLSSSPMSDMKKSTFRKPEFQFRSKTHSLNDYLAHSYINSKGTYCHL